MRNIKTGLIVVLTGIYLLVVSALLTLALEQAIILIQLYRVSAAPSAAADLDGLLRFRMSFGNDILIWTIITVVLFVLVFKYRRRLLPVSISAILLFVALNLYSGRHLLPQLLIWPTPNSLAEQYVQALAANDLTTVLRLSGPSDECQAKMTQVFQNHLTQLKQKVGTDQSEIDIRSVIGRNITTFYDKPVATGFMIMQPVPQQLVTIMVEMENHGSIWLNLKMSYSPFLGMRYICGQDID